MFQAVSYRQVAAGTGGHMDLFGRSIGTGGLERGPQSPQVNAEITVTKVPKEGPEYEEFLKYVGDLSSRVFVPANDSRRIKASGGLEWAIDAESARVMSRSDTCDFYKVTRNGMPAGFAYVMWAKTLSDSGGVSLPENRGFAWKEYYDPNDSRARPGEIFLPNSRLFDWGEGYVFRPSASLQYIAVEPEMRREGLGTELLDRITADMRQQGIEYMFLTVDRRNQCARQFVESHGFSPDGEIIVDDYNLQGGAPTDRESYQVVWEEYMRELV